MSLRPVQLAEEGTGTRQRAHRVISVDESGNPVGDEPYVLSAVSCPRESGELLAEHLVDAGLNPWTNKSRSLSTTLPDQADQNSRVEAFLRSIDDEERITWSSAAGWQSYDVPLRAAAACTVGSRTLTTPHRETQLSLHDETVLIHDGGADTYGPKQRVLRQQAAAKFDSSFQSVFCPVVVTSLVKADLTYPEVIAADYIAGYIRHRLRQETDTIETLPPQVNRIDKDWVEPEMTPLSSHWIRTSSGGPPDEARTRMLAWMEGRRPPNVQNTTTKGSYESLLQQLDSTAVAHYLREL